MSRLPSLYAFCPSCRYTCIDCVSHFDPNREKCIKSLIPSPFPFYISLSRVRREIERADYEDFLHMVVHNLHVPDCEVEDNGVAVLFGVETFRGHVSWALRVRSALEDILAADVDILQGCHILDREEVGNDAVVLLKECIVLECLVYLLLVHDESKDTLVVEVDDR